MYINNMGKQGLLSHTKQQNKKPKQKHRITHSR